MKNNTAGLPTPKVVRASAETRRILAVSDIHGNLPLFQRLLEQMDYRPGEDTLVIAGDMLEKGPRSLDTLQFVLELASAENVYVLCGNCDYSQDDEPEDAWKHLDYWQDKATHWQMGLRAGIDMPTGPDNVLEYRRKLEVLYPREHAFLRNLPHILETEHYLFAHAGLRDEDLEHQELGYVLSAPRFHETAEHVFSKRLVVGHYPTSNFRKKDWIDNAPLCNEARNILSIDGGNVVKTLGQLNGVILENGTGNWSWTAGDGFPKIQVPRSRKAEPGTVVMWPENRVEVLERGREFARCRAVHSGAVLEIPLEFLYEDDTGCYCDATDSRLGVEQGDTVSLVREYSDRLLLMKGGKVGYLYL